MITLRTDQLQVIVDPDHGAEIVAVAGRDGVNLLARFDWQSPLPARAGSSYGDNTTDWMSEYRGGWQELFPNAGAPCTVMGVPLPFHGEVSRAQWAYEWLAEPTAVRLRCPARLPLILERTMRLDPERPVLYLEERITNEAPFAVPYMWGHHPAFGAALAAPGAIIDLPGGAITVDAGYDGPNNDLIPGSAGAWPHVTGKTGALVDLSRIPSAPVQRFAVVRQLHDGWYAIRNVAGGRGVALSWDLAAFPCLWYWQDIHGNPEYPWYGRAHLAALEPISNWPSTGLADAVAAGGAYMLEAGASVSAWLTCVCFAATDRAVVGVSRAGELALAE